MATEFAAAKITPATVKAVKLVAALTGEKQYEVIERLVLAERDRLQLASVQPALKTS